MVFTVISVIRDHCPAWIIKLPFSVIVPKFFVRDLSMADAIS